MLIENDTMLRKYIPNVLATCDGEISLYDKLKLYPSSSERWLQQYFVGALLASIVEEGEDGAMLALCCRIVVADAFGSALPSLDLVLTPSGFGIVSNGNLAPASAERVKTLAESLTAIRDTALQELLLLLSSNTTWRGSEQGKYFGATLFPNLSLSRLAGKDTRLWDNYQQLWQPLRSIEAELAANYISEAVYQRLRQHAQEGTLSLSEQPLVHDLRSVELDLLLGKPLNRTLLIRLVNDIRQSTEFPEWATSPTASYFKMQSFENKKENHGYWF